MGKSSSAIKCVGAGASDNYVLLVSVGKLSSVIEHITESCNRECILVFPKHSSRLVSGWHSVSFGSAEMEGRL
jgi:hypothetical protein